MWRRLAILPSLVVSSGVVFKKDGRALGKDVAAGDDGLGSGQRADRRKPMDLIMPVRGERCAVKQKSTNVQYDTLE